jgi:hypothetical protein
MSFRINIIKISMCAFIVIVTSNQISWASSFGMPKTQPLSLKLSYQGVASEPIPTPEGKQWRRFANHTHTSYSPDADATVEQRIRGAAAEGAESVVMTDHNRDSACSDSMFKPMDGCAPMCGMEYAWHAFDGELNLLNLGGAGSGVGGSTVEEVVQSALNVGATVVVNHPFVATEPWSYEDLHLGISGIEVWTSKLFSLSGGDAALSWWNGFLAKGKIVFCIGGSDNHVDAPLSLKPCNYVLAATAEPDDIQDGFDAGSLTISSSESGPRCFLWCDSDGDGAFEKIMGNNVTTSANDSLRFRAEVYDGEGRTLSVITKQGEFGAYDVKTGDPWFVEFTASFSDVKDYVRCELRTDNPAYPIDSVTNPIYVNYTPGDSDSDGVTDKNEMLWRTEHYSADSDNDGVSDGYEIGYDGDVSTYDPYDAEENPNGGDMNALKADSDGDGMDDAQELALGSNPLDPSDIAMLPLPSAAWIIVGVLAVGASMLSRRACR